LVHAGYFLIDRNDSLPKMIENVII
jgi:hypothetical protein